MICDRELLPCSVGDLLYTPALNTSIVKKIINDEIPALTTLTFCLEESILDNSLADAEVQLKIYWLKYRLCVNSWGRANLKKTEVLRE